MFQKFSPRFVTSVLIVPLLFAQVLTVSAQSLPKQQPAADTATTEIFLPLVFTETDASERAEEIKASLVFPWAQIVAVHSNKCLYVPNAWQADQVQIQQIGCSWDSNKLWDSGVANISPFNTLIVKHSGKCMDVAGLSLADQAIVQQYTCNGGANQQWYFIPFGASNIYLIVSKNSGKCLDVAGASLADGVRVQQYRCHGGRNQQFYLRQLP